MEWITQPETWVALLTLVALELVLGVDNVIFISGDLACCLAQRRIGSCLHADPFSGI